MVAFLGRRQQGRGAELTQRGRAAARSVAVGGGAGRPQGGLAARRSRLRTVVEPVVTAAGYDLEDLTVSRAGRRHLVRVIVDGDAGVGLDEVAQISRTVSAALDRAEESGGELLAGEYQLEVSSPGVDRPLTLPRHWRRNVGRLVKVAVTGPGEPPQPRTPPGARQVTARVLAADDDGVALDTDAGPVRWAYPQLGPGRVQVEFNRLDDAVDDDLAEVEDIDDDDDVEDEER
jgi:ribosome maturation factor RimP